MCALENELENQLGEFHIRMKGESNQKYKTKVITQNKTQIFTKIIKHADGWMYGWTDDGWME